MNIFRKETGFSSSCLLAESESSKYRGAQWRKCCRRKVLPSPKPKLTGKKTLCFLCYCCKLSGCLFWVYFSSQTLPPKDPDWPRVRERNVCRLSYWMKNLLNLSSGGLWFPKFSLGDASLSRIREMFTFESLASLKIKQNCKCMLNPPFAVMISWLVTCRHSSGECKALSPVSTHFTDMRRNSTYMRGKHQNRSLQINMFVALKNSPKCGFLQQETHSFCSK